MAIELIRKDYTPAHIDLPPGERSFVAWITMDIVDNEGDVVIGSGVDTKSVFMGVNGDPARPGNPVVMAVHDYQRWPLGTCEWIKLAKPYAKSTFSGLKAKTFIDEDPDALKVFGMIQRRVVRGVSIGFRPPDDMKTSEWGPPTAQELRERPDWKTARRIIRRAVLLEYSVVPIPMNQSALIFAVSKGLPLPSYLQPVVTNMKADERTMKPMVTKGMHVKCKGGACGKIKSLHDDGVMPEGEDFDDERDDDQSGEAAALVEMHDDKCMPTGKIKCYGMKDMEDFDGPDGKALSGSSGTGGGYLVAPGGGDGEEAPEEQDEPIKKGDRVHCEKGANHPACVGMVKSVHTSGKVGGCLNSAEASEEMPHARVKCYKSMDHPFHFHETDDHYAVPVAKCKRLDTIMTRPGGKGYGAEVDVSHDGGERITMHDPSGCVAQFAECPAVSGGWRPDDAALRVKQYAVGAQGRLTGCYAWAQGDDRRLQIKDIRGGRLVVVKEAVDAAMLAIGVLPPSDRAAAFSLLKQYRALFGDDAAPDAESKSVPTFRTEAQWEAEIVRKARERIASEKTPESLAQDVLDRVLGTL